jgi:ABC-2 type transport system ATP-binding protein
VIVLRDGLIVAEGSPGSLGTVPGVEIRFRLPAGVAPPELPNLVFSSTDEGFAARCDTPTEALHALTGWALEHGVELEGIEVRRPSLEDVYLELTAPSEEVVS